jgi:hypothetical protein
MGSACARSAPRIGWVWPCALACATLATPSLVRVVHAQDAQDAPPASVAAAPVAYKPEPPLRSYVAIRRLESANDRHNKAAWLVVRTCLQDGTFTWEVLEEGGSELIRKRVLLETLDKEAQVHREGLSWRGGLTQDNYTFSEPLPVEGGVRVRLEPRKREDMLIKGEMLLSPEGMLLRVEGDLVKRPSFWTKSVHLIRQYGRVEGTHVPLRLDIVSQVRLVGTSRLSMTYKYLEINGRPVQDLSGETAVLTRANSARGSSQ